MGYSGGLISKPVRTIDIAQALGVASRDVGTLCTSDKINMWAKRKPIKLNIFREVTDAERGVCRFGIRQNTQTGFWELDLPRGIAYSEPFRMLDFNGYNVNAVAPMYDFYEVPSPFNPDTDQLRISPNEFFRRAGGNVELPLELFPSLYTNEYYIGLLVKDRTTGRMIYFTGENTMYQFFHGGTMQTVNVSLENLSANAGDLIEIWVCCAQSPNVNGSVCTQNMLEGGVVQKIALSETLGHALTVAGVFSVSDIYFLGNMSGFYDMFRPAITSPQYYRSHLTGAAVDLFVDYLFSASETPKIYIELFADSEVVAHKVMSLGPSVVDQYGMFTAQFTCDKYIEFAQGDTDFPVNFDIAVRRADVDGNPVGTRQYMWNRYTFDAQLQRATYVGGLQEHDPWSIDELYFLDTGRKIVPGETVFFQSYSGLFEDRSKGKTRRTYSLIFPAGLDVDWEESERNKILIELPPNIPEGEEYTMEFKGHIGPADYPTYARSIKFVYLP